MGLVVIPRCPTIREIARDLFLVDNEVYRIYLTNPTTPYVSSVLVTTQG